MKKNIYFLLLILIPFLLELNLPACSSSNRNLNKDKDTTKVGKQIPPVVNSANVEAEILSYEETNGYINCSLKILQVKSYGSSTPPLPVGTIIKAEVTSSSIKNTKLSKEELLSKGAKYNIMLKHLVVPSNVESPSWEITSVE